MATEIQRNSLPDTYKVVADSIRVGKSSATLLSDIMSIADIKDRRTAYQIIEELIVKHGYESKLARVKGKRPRRVYQLINTIEI